MIAAPINTQSLFARFTTEQKALARLSHPYICSFIELGETPSGSPYYVMEYIDGVDILQYANQQKLSVNARIDLWLKVCDAVQSSHRNLVLHRDIKPSNVLVQTDGLPKLLDFGVAKLIEDGMDSSQTLAFGANLTLDYASPERLTRGESSTLDDQYALVVLLHELILAGRPFIRSSKNIEQLISEVSNTFPATLIRQWDQLSPQIQREVSEQRCTSIRALRNLLTSDLDSIIRKGLHPDPEQRYATIDALIADINRYKAQLPVQAKNAQWTYILSRFIRRNSILVSAVIAVLLTLSSALIYSIEQTQEANRQLRRAEATSQFLSSIIEAPSTRWNSELRVGSEASMQEVLEAASLNLHESTRLPPEIKSQLHLSLGEAFMAWGMPDEVIRENRRALSISRTELPLDHRMQQRSRLSLGIALDMWRKEESLLEAAQLVQESVEWLRQYAPTDYPVIASAVGEIGYNAAIRGDFKTAAEYYQEAIDIWYASGGARIDTWAAVAHSLTAEAYYETGDYAKAEREWLLTQDILHQLDGVPIPEWDLSFYGLLRLAMFRGDASLIRSRANDIVEFGARADPNNRGVHTEMTWVALAYLLIDELELAGDLLDELDTKQATMPEEAEYFNAIQRVRALWLVANGHHSEALRMFSDLETVYPSYDQTSKFLFHVGRGESLIALGRRNQARDAAQQAQGLIPNSMVANSIPRLKLDALQSQTTYTE